MQSAMGVVGHGQRFIGERCERCSKAYIINNRSNRQFSCVSLHHSVHLDFIHQVEATAKTYGYDVPCNRSDKC
jgi:hypothetical protein